MSRFSYDFSLQILERNAAHLPLEVVVVSVCIVREKNVTSELHVSGDLCQTLAVGFYSGRQYLCSHLRVWHMFSESPGLQGANRSNRPQCAVSRCVLETATIRHRKVRNDFSARTASSGRSGQFRAEEESVCALVSESRHAPFGRAELLGKASGLCGWKLAGVSGKAVGKVGSDRCCVAYALHL